MAFAKFHSVRGEKSALIMVKANPLEFSSTPVYVPRSGVEALTNMKIEDIKQGHPFEIQEGYRIVELVDIETGEVRTAKDGSPLKTLSYS